MQQTIWTEFINFLLVLYIIEQQYSATKFD